MHVRAKTLLPIFFVATILCLSYIIYSVSTGAKTLSDLLDVPNNIGNCSHARIIIQDKNTMDFTEFTCNEASLLNQFLTEAQYTPVEFIGYNKYTDMALSAGIFDIEIYGVFNGTQFASNRIKINTLGNICTYNGQEYLICDHIQIEKIVGLLHNIEDKARSTRGRFFCVASQKSAERQGDGSFVLTKQTPGAKVMASGV